MTTLFTKRQTDGESAEHTISSDITTIVAKAEPNWERVRLIAMLEDVVGSGTFTAVADWEMTAPGSKNVVTNSSAGRKLKLLQLGSSLTDSTPKITVDAN